MCSLVEDVINESRIFESVKRIYDIQSSSEDSLDHHKRRRSLIKNSRALRTASLFIDRLKSEFQRGDDFVPRFRSHRNWCPKFPSKYFSEREEGEHSKSLDKSVSRNFIHETPKIYSIGLYEPRMRRRVNDSGEKDGVIDIGNTVEYFKRCSFLARRNPSSNIPNESPHEIIDLKQQIPTLPSFPTLSIPLIPPFSISADSVVKSKNIVSHSTNSSHKRRVASCDRSESPRKDERVHMKATSLPRIQSLENDHQSRQVSRKIMYSSECDSKLQWGNSSNDLVYSSISQQSFVEEGSEPEKTIREKEELISNERSTCSEERFISPERTSNDCIQHEKIIVNIVNCKTSQEFLRDGSPDQLVEDLFLENISIESSTSKSKEFFSPIETSSEMEALSTVLYGEGEILEDIRRRIDKDFESSSLKLEEDIEDFCFSHNSRFLDKTYSLDNESFLDLDDDLLTSIEQSKSMPSMITSTATKRLSSKSVTLMSSTLVEDDFYDPRITLSREKFKEYRTIESNDSKYPSYTDLSSMNSIICYSTYDFPSTCLENTIVSPENTLPMGSVDYRNFDVHNVLSRSFSISDASMSKEYEHNSSKNDVCCLDFSNETENILTSSKSEYETIGESSDYDRSKTNLTKELLRGSPLKERKSSKHLVESIDSGVITDYSRNDLRACESIVTKKTNAYYIYENQFDAKESDNLPMFDFDSDSTYSDDSLDRRVDRAVKKCTEDLILLERRIKVKLKKIENQTVESTDDFLTFFDWPSGDERIGSISTPSLVSLTDSEKS